MKTQKRHIFWFILIRTIAVTSILVAVVIIQSSTSAFIPVVPFYFIVLLAYLLSLVYLPAGLSAILFGVLVDGLYFGIIPYFSPDQYRERSLGLVLFTMFLAWSLIFLIAFLANYLTNNLRKAREELLLAQKELEIKERLATAGRFSAQLAHEVRNPLAAISGAVQVLRGELTLDAEQRSLMEIVVKESERVSQSIERFLELASPGPQVFSWVKLPEILEETLALLRASGELDGRHLLAGNYPSAKVDYYGNPNQFKQVFWNLAKNAAKAMPEGGTLR